MSEDKPLPFSRGGALPDGVRLTVEREGQRQRTGSLIFWTLAWIVYVSALLCRIVSVVMIYYTPPGGEVPPAFMPISLASFVVIPMAIIMFVAGVAIQRSNHRTSRFSDHERRVARASWICVVASLTAVEVALSVMGFSAIIFLVSEVS